MNYKALYRTYRPANFVEVEGQNHVIKTLINLIKLKKISHAYLFSGPRGTGKTSVAKIFANVINCGHNQNIEIACPQCIMSINNSVDVIEIDAASNNGINEIRELREKVKFSPTKFKYKVYIIDEVHMLTKGAFNALLKTLEEPPKHIIFILATTDPDKLPLTILSRVQRYNFKRISKDVIQKQIKFVFGKEKINSESGVIEMIANLSNGSLRDALSISDQINAYSNSNIKMEDINDVFGLTSKKNQVLLLQHCANNFVSLALKLFNNLVNQGIDIRRLLNSLINLLKEYLLFSKTGDESIIQEFDPKLLSTIYLQEDFVYDVIDVLITLLNEIKYSDIPQQLSQIAIIKICSLSKNNNFNTIKNVDKSIRTTAKENTNTNYVKINEITDNFVIQQDTPNHKNSKKDVNTYENTKDGGKSLNNEEKFFKNEDDGAQLIKDTTDILNLSNEANIDIDHIEGSMLGHIDNNAIVYDTNEILENKQNKKSQTNDFEKTNSFNMKRINEMDFNFTSKNNKNLDIQEKKVLTQPDIINLFLLGNKEDIINSKTKMAESLLSTKNEYSEIISYLENCKIITSSKDFVLFSSEEKASIDFLLMNSNNDDLINFMFHTFGNTRHIFAITKTNFLDSAELFKELKMNGSLPDPISLLSPLPKKEIIKPTTSESFEAEKKGLNIFGNIFNKKDKR